MQLETFIAESATDAVSQIRAKLGPEAVVVNVRQRPGRLWQKPRIEVLAHAPQPDSQSERAEEPAQTPSLARMLHEPHETVAYCSGGLRPPNVVDSSECGAHRAPLQLPHESPRQADDAAGWRVAAVLESLGLLPRYAERVAEELRATYGDRPPGSVAQELRLARDILCRMWPTRRVGREQPFTAGPVTSLHVFVGAPGVGKTTALCKWLTQAVLLDGRTARVWRLDGRTANTAELLSVHGDILGVPVERSWTGEPVTEELLFMDLPGIEGDAGSVGELAEQLARWPSAQVHLALNAAYETTALLAQARAFSALPISDLVVTHLDEEQRWGKVWNLVLDANLSIRFLGAGQNIPGEFFDATPERLLAHDFPLK